MIFNWRAALYRAGWTIWPGRIGAVIGKAPVTPTPSSIVFQYLSSPLLHLPAAANGVTVTSSSTAWNNSSWVEIEDSIANTSLLVAISAFCTDTGNSHQFEVDIGKGAAGSETVVTTIRGKSNPVLLNIGEDSVFNLPIAIDGFASGNRVACRIRTSASSAIDFRVKISVVATGYSGSITTTTKPVKVSPSAAAMVQCTTHATLTWTNVGWTQFLASTSADWVIVGVCVSCGTDRWEIDFATGSAGNEVVFMTIRGMSDVTRNSNIMFPCPVDKVASGDRIAIRARDNLTSRVAMVGIMYVEKPL